MDSEGMLDWYSSKKLTLENDITAYIKLESHCVDAILFQFRTSSMISSKH